VSSALSARSAERGERRLTEALCRLEIEPVSVGTLDALEPWSRTPRTYEVLTGDGTRVKIRFARRARYAARAARLTSLLGDPRVRPPVAVSGTAMVEHWVEGEMLAALPLGVSYVEAAADLLAAVHGFRVQPRSTDAMRPMVSSRLRELSAAGLVATAAANRIEQLVSHGLPAESAWGVTHGDFCDENLVVARDGGLASIDNEQFAWGFLDYDLARSWYRWPMPAWAQKRFSRRYTSASGRAVDPDKAQAWRAVATVNGLWIRRRWRSSPELELRALRRVLGVRSYGAPQTRGVSEG
jgi:aminoglycoside phosphotransferase (APT) family kinase protein